MTSTNTEVESYPGSPPEARKGKRNSKYEHPVNFHVNADYCVDDHASPLKATVKLTSVSLPEVCLHPMFQLAIFLDVPRMSNELLKMILLKILLVPQGNPFKLL